MAIRKGKKILESGSGDGIFLQTPPDETVEIAPLCGMEELLSADYHSFWSINPAIHVLCSEDDCAACELGNEPRFKGWLPVVTKEGDVKIYAFGISVARMLDELEGEIGEITGHVIRIKRTGSGLATRYNVINIGKKIKVDKHEIPDIPAILGPDDPDEIREILRSAGLLAGGKKKKAADEEDIADWEDV